MDILNTINNLKQSNIELKLADLLFKNDKETVKHLFNYLFYYIPTSKFVFQKKLIFSHIFCKVLKENELDDYFQSCCEIALLFKSEINSTINNSEEFFKVAKKASLKLNSECRKLLRFKRHIDFKNFEELTEIKNTKEDILDLIASIDFKEFLKTLSKKQKEALILKITGKKKFQTKTKKIIQDKYNKYFN